MRINPEHKQSYSLKQMVSVGLLSWITVIGFDFFLHGGLLSRLYTQPSPFLLPPATAYRFIPVGYLSFLILIVLLLWLMLRLRITGWFEGLKFGFILGVLAWGSFTLGLLSISTASIALLVGWFLGQATELAIAGLVIGSGLSAKRLTSLALKVTAFFIAMLMLTILMQSVGLATAVRI